MNTRDDQGDDGYVDHGQDFTISSRNSLAKFFDDCSLMPRAINFADGPT